VSQMKPHWKELLPIDRYNVQMKGILHDLDVKIITSLYQPLIGSKAYSLYMTLWNELDGNQINTYESTHHSLMSMTQMNLGEIYVERKKMEGIGLLKTFKKEDEQYRIFYYELQPPLLPEQFFNDDVLNIYLYSRIGKMKYLETRKRFLKPKQNLSEMEAVTSSFNDAFESIHQSELMTSKHSEVSENIRINSSEQFVQREMPDELYFKSDTFDYELLMQDLSSFILPKELITEEIKESIIRLAFVYSIEPLEMSSILQQAYMNDGELTIESLRKSVQNWYRFEYPNDLPALSERIQPIELQKMRDKQPSSQQEKVVKAFETISPKQLLEHYSNGSKPAASDMKVIESIMIDQKLNPGVINVLIDYVLYTNDMKLIHAYTEKIASHWKRKNVITVEQAMALARAEHKKYQEWSNNKTKGKNTAKTVRKNVKTDKLPKWWKNKNSTNKETEKGNSETLEPKEAQGEQWLEDYLKDL
jgi:replication initiation and membrane attachment protein